MIVPWLYLVWVQQIDTKEEYIKGGCLSRQERGAQHVSPKQKKAVFWNQLLEADDLWNPTTFDYALATDVRAIMLLWYYYLDAGVDFL